MSIVCMIKEKNKFQSRFCALIENHTGEHKYYTLEEIREAMD